MYKPITTKPKTCPLSTSKPTTTTTTTPTPTNTIQATTITTPTAVAPTTTPNTDTQSKIGVKFISLSQCHIGIYNSLITQSAIKCSK